MARASFAGLGYWSGSAFQHFTNWSRRFLSATSLLQTSSRNPSTVAGAPMMTPFAADRPSWSRRPGLCQRHFVVVQGPLFHEPDAGRRNPVEDEFRVVDLPEVLAE